MAATDANIAHHHAHPRFRMLMIVTALLDGLYAIALVFSPETFLSMHGLDANASSVFTTRLLSPAVISDTVLAFIFLNTQSHGAIRAISLKFCLSWGIGGLVFIIGSMTVAGMTAAAWADAVFAAIFAAAYGYYLLTAPRDS